MKLYEIADNYRRFLEDFEESDLPPEVMADTLEAIEGEVQKKVIAIAAFIKETEADAKAIEDAIKAMQDRAKAKRNRADSLKAYTLNVLESRGLKKIECHWFQVRTQANGGKTPLHYDSELLPDSYKISRTVIDIDTDGLRIALENGAVIPGASLGERGKHLRIT